MSVCTCSAGVIENCPIHGDDDLPQILVPLSMRDYFAAMALQGLISRGFDPCADTARMAFQMADAMLKERVK